MAVSISLMFARLGGVAGSNAGAFLLDNYCESAFYLSGSVTAGNIILNNIVDVLYFLNNIFLFFQFSAMGVLAFFIPNIHMRVNDIVLMRSENRLSIISTRESVISLK